jgi:hypothetical protein
MFCITIQRHFLRSFGSYFAEGFRTVGDFVFAASLRSWSKVRSTFRGFSFGGFFSLLGFLFIISWTDLNDESELFESFRDCTSIISVFNA